MVKGKDTKTAEENANKFLVQHSSYQKIGEQLVVGQAVISNPLYSLQQTFDTLRKKIEKINTSLPKDKVNQLLESIEENYKFTQEELQGDSETLFSLAEIGKDLIKELQEKLNELSRNLPAYCTKEFRELNQCYDRLPKDYGNCKVEEPIKVTMASAVTSEFWQTTTTTSSSAFSAPTANGISTGNIFSAHTTKLELVKTNPHAKTGNIVSGTGDTLITAVDKETNPQILDKLAALKQHPPH